MQLIEIYYIRWGKKIKQTFLLFRILDKILKLTNLFGQFLNSINFPILSGFPGSMAISSHKKSAKTSGEQKVMHFILIQCCLNF